MSIFPTVRFAACRRWLLHIVILGLAGLGSLACEGPTGPEGPQGEQGPSGTDPSIINLDLSNHVQGTTFDRGSNTLTPKNDTLSIKWGATMDTTITSVTIADSQYAAVYVRVPGVGFQRAPVRFNVDGTQNVSDVVQEADPFAQVEYNLLRQLPSPARDSFFAADAVGGTDRRFYTAVTDRFDIHEAVVEPGEFAVTVRAYEAEDGSEYESGIAEGFTSPLVPFDNDLSDTSPNNYPNANSSGEIEYRQVATDLGAIRNAVGTNLRLEKYELRAVKQGAVGPIGRVFGPGNPGRIDRPRRDARRDPDPLRDHRLRAVPLDVARRADSGDRAPRRVARPGALSGDLRGPAPRWRVRSRLSARALADRGERVVGAMSYSPAPVTSGRSRSRHSVRLPSKNATSS